MSNMAIKFKQVKEVKQFCTDCGEQLKGNGSMVLPYECPCGIWNLCFVCGKFDHHVELNCPERIQVSI